jgi:CHAT domain-containing protein
MICHPILLRVRPLCAAVLASLALSSASAATHDQILQMCRERMHPQVMACASAKGLRGDPEAIRQQCGMVYVRPCVISEEQKQAAHTAAPAAPKDEDAAAPAGAAAVRPVFVAPPRTIADITAILDSEKPNETKIAARQAAADAAPPTGASPAKLAQFYYDRGNARALLARNREALADGQQALAVGKDIEFRHAWRIRQFVGLQYRSLGDLKEAMAVFDALARDGSKLEARGSTINALASQARISILLGDSKQADAYARRVEALVQEARGSPNPKWRSYYSIYGRAWEADANAVRAMVFEARGQYADAEAAFRRGEAFRRAAIRDLPRFEFPPPLEQMKLAVATMLLSTARNEAKQQRLSEAEADARRALLQTLDDQSKYNPATPPFIIELAGVLVDQGRYQDAEKLARSALDVQRAVGIGDDSQETAYILTHLGNILVLQRKNKEAAEVYAELDKAIAQWTPQRRQAFELNGSRIVALYRAGDVQAGIAAAERLVKEEAARTGDGGFNTATARGTLALGYALAGRDAEAIREFKAVIPIMMSAARENADDDDSTTVASRNARLQRAVEAYIGLLARDASDTVATETFALADAVRGHAVQQALAASSARMAAKEAALADLVRKDQDLEKQIGAELGVLNNLLSLPSEQRDDSNVRAVNAEINKLRADRKAAQQEIKHRFPAYAELIDPKPATVDEIRGALRPSEVLLSFYFGQDASFVWVVPKDGGVAFATLPTTAPALVGKVQRLRQALEPQVARVDELPPFDLGLASELYDLLLKPVEAAWKPAKNLIVVTNGALGELPLALLPTAPARVDPQAKPLFVDYRNVPWLARTHAVTSIPSASALVALRRLPAPSPQRDKLIGFGDPYFSEQEAAEAEGGSPTAALAEAAPAANDSVADLGTRGLALRLRATPHTEEVDKAELALLPRLPDTREELIAIARALDADPATALYLGKAANEQNVETIDLAKYRVVAFATHGLVPGDIDGLTQPALALTASDVAGVSGDGLLTIEKILALKLDADWVVLSACNTAAGAGAGAEAASGLGSAFFYAGTRALLVTNWSVQSASARELVSVLFRRQSADPGLSRGEALRQAMMALVDGPGAVDDAGHTLYTYAHPLFWAPYTVIGDGGGS